jgi:hypothetical protein
MAELEHALLALGRELELPATPDLVTPVRRRIAARRRRATRRWAVLSVAILVVGFGVAMAVPDARSSILRFFHIGSVTVERVETLPPAREAPLTAGLGPARTRADAERIAGFRMILPSFKGQEPTRYYASLGLLSTLLSVHDLPVLLTELSGDQAGFAKKYASGETRVQPVEVRSHFGLFMSGGEHVIVYQVPARNTVHQVATRLAGNVLLWAAGDRTFRLEGRIGESDAMKIARELTH